MFEFCVKARLNRRLLHSWRFILHSYGVIRHCIAKRPVVETASLYKSGIYPCLFQKASTALWYVTGWHHNRVRLYTVRSSPVRIRMNEVSAPLPPLAPLSIIIYSKRYIICVLSFFNSFCPRYEPLSSVRWWIQVGWTRAGVSLGRCWAVGQVRAVSCHTWRAVVKTRTVS
jgi:hypothetical protein